MNDYFINGMDSLGRVLPLTFNFMDVLYLADSERGIEEAQ